MTNRIIRRGFELLETRAFGSKKELTLLEEQYGIQLPPIYKLFAEMFLVGESKNTIAYLLPDESIQYCAGIFYTINDSIVEDVMFDNFLTVESTFFGFDADDDWLENGYIPIATCAHGGSILLATQEHNKDNILLQDNHGKIRLLNENIFDFVRCLSMMEVIEENLTGDIKFNDLYKQWREDFWRIRNN